MKNTITVSVCMTIIVNYGLSKSLVGSAELKLLTVENKKKTSKIKNC